MKNYVKILVSSSIIALGLGTTIISNSVYCGVNSTISQTNDILDIVKNVRQKISETYKTPQELAKSEPATNLDTALANYQQRFETLRREVISTANQLDTIFDQWGTDRTGVKSALNFFRVKYDSKKLKELNEYIKQIKQKSISAYSTKLRNVANTLEKF